MKTSFPIAGLHKRQPLGFATTLAALALLGVPNAASAVDTLLTLTQINDPSTNQPTDIQCIIYGNSCPGGQQAMDVLNYAQKGSVGDWNLMSLGGVAPTFAGVAASTDFAQVDKDGGGFGVNGNYTVGYLAGYVGKVFDVGIDVNTTGAKGETLQLFKVTVGTDTFTYTGPTNIAGGINNGNGFFDWRLSTINLNGYNANTVVTFQAVWTNASDGAENFFLIPSAVPEPGTYAMMLAGLGVVGFMARRRQKLR